MVMAMVILVKKEAMVRMVWVRLMVSISSAHTSSASAWIRSSQKMHPVPTRCLELGACCAPQGCDLWWPGFFAVHQP